MTPFSRYRDCPRCGDEFRADRADAIAEDEEDGFIIRTFRCPHCGMVFAEVYEYIRDEDEDGNEIVEKDDDD